MDNLLGIKPLLAYTIASQVWAHLESSGLAKIPGIIIPPGLGNNIYDVVSILVICEIPIKF